MHLLFCNTFTYDAQASSSNWAVIKFPCMIAVDFIKVIAPGVKAHSQLRDDQYIGKTSPGKFRLEIFSDDCSASMTTYEHVGYLDYSEATHCEFRPASALYSEKLLLNGWFTRLTVAVYGGILSDVSMSNPSIDLAVKTPSLVIHEKPEGRSVYIRGTQDLPKLTTELEKPEPLMASFPPSNKNYLSAGNNSGRRDSGGYGNESISNMHPVYYDRRQPRPKSFNTDSNRGHHKSYAEERSEYLGSQPKGTARKNLGSDAETDVSSSRNNGNDRISYRDRNRQFADQHQRHSKRDNADSSSLTGGRLNIVSQNDIPAKRFSNSSRDPSNSPRPVASTEAEESDATQEWVDGEYEEISDEEAEEERFSSLHELDEIMDGDELVPSTAAFNPFLTEPAQLMHFSHPGINDFEIACSNILTDDDQGLSQQGNEENTARFESLLTKAKKIGKLKSGKPLPTLIISSREGKDWVSVVEEIIPLVTVALPGFFITSRQKYDEYLSFLVASVFAGLDIGLASKQPIGINLRMLKCGINLAYKLCQTTQDIVTFLTTGKLDAKLVSLLIEDNMASSIKIMIIHTLDAYLSWPCALASYFQDEGKSKKSYLNLVELILVPQASRVATALSRLMNKISLFHAMWKLRNVVQELVEEKVPHLPEEFDFVDDYIEDIIEDEVIGEDDEDIIVTSPLHTGDDVEIHHPSETLKSNEKSGCDYDGNDADRLTSVVHMDNWSISQEMDIIIESLNLILHSLEDVAGTITQLPKRAFPTTADVSNVSEKASVTCIFRLMEYYNVLPSIQVLLSLPFVSGYFNLYQSAYKLLDFLMARQDGLLFIAFNSSHITCLARHLLSSSTDLSEVEEPGTAPHLGAKLAFHMQCIQCIDQLKVLSESGGEDVLSSEDSIDVLRMVYSLTFPTYGKYWTASIFSLNDNIQALLAFVQRVKEEDKLESKPKEPDENEEEKTEQTKKKSVRKTAAGGFASSLLLLTLKMSPNVGYLLQHKDSILNTIRCAPISRFIEEVNEWLRPLESLKTETNVIQQCMDYVKGTFSKLEWNTLMTTGPGLCTALRTLCVTTGAVENRPLTIKSLQYALQMFGGGGLSVLVEGIERINKCYEYPCYSQHALTTVFSFNFHNLLAALSENMLILIKHLLDALLTTDDGKFDPNLLTKLLVEHYAGMYVILRESNVAKLEGITQLIVSIYGLLLRRNMTPESSTDIQEGNHRTCLLQHVLSATQQHCQHFVPGLILLSHLLPMPLPIVSQNIEGGATSEVKKQRSLWSASLSLIVGEFNAFFSTVCQSTCIPLLEILIPLIQQICDLSSTLAKNLIVSIVDACVVIETPPENKPEQEAQESADPKYTFKSHPLMILAEIGSLPAAKHALVEYLESDKNKLQSLWTMARNQAKSGSPYLLDAAIRLISILVDPNIDFLQETISAHGIDGVLPSEMLTDVVKLCCTALESVNLSTLIECLYCLYFLCMNNECFCELKHALSANATLLYDLLAVLVKAWDKDQDSSCIVLMGLCDLMQCLTLSQERRSSSLTKSELRSFLKWDSDIKANQHPFTILRKRIEESEDDSEIFDETLNQISVLYDNLRSSQEFQLVGKKRKHPKSSESLSLSKQFDIRPWHIYGDDDSIFSCRFALLGGDVQNSILHPNVRKVDDAKVDLISMAEKNCSGFNLETSFKDMTDSAKATDIDKLRLEAKAKRLRKLETFSTRHGKTLTFIKRSHGLLMTGVRGRGRGRGSSMGRQNDLFRQRKQNTSRPPSMHVDDFIAADEEDNNSSTSGTGESFVPPPSLAPTFSTRRPPTFKRDFTPRGRSSRGMARTGARGNYAFVGVGGTGDTVNGNEKFRSRTVGSHPTDRFVRGRGRGRDPTRSFTPRDSFKPKPQQQSWNFSGQRNVGGSSPSGFRGNGRVKSLMRIGRPLLPPPVNVKWGGMPPPRRGRGYGKPRGKHPRSFTR